MQNDVYGSDTFYFIYCGISTWPTTVLLNSSDTSTPVLPQRTSIKNALLSFFHNLPRLLPAPIISDLNLVRNMPTRSQKGLDEHAPVKMKSIVLRPSAPWINEEIREFRKRLRKLKESGGWTNWPLALRSIRTTPSLRTTHRYSVLLKRVKSVHMQSEVAECGTNQRALYGLVNRLMGKRDVSSLPPTPLNKF